jgi:hypothetical protein
MGFLSATWEVAAGVEKVGIAMASMTEAGVGVDYAAAFHCGFVHVTYVELVACPSFPAGAADVL